MFFLDKFLILEETQQLRQMLRQRKVLLVEREIFMKAMDQKNKKQRDEFEEMIKDKDQMIKTLKEKYGKPMSEWTW